MDQCSQIVTCNRKGHNYSKLKKNYFYIIFSEAAKGDESMAKAGMRRPDPKDPHGTESNHKTHIPKNDLPPVPEIQGKAKNGKEKARPV